MLLYNKKVKSKYGILEWVNKKNQNKGFEAMYRIKQFIWAITAMYKPVDDKLLNRYLTKREKKLFKNLKVSEQQHSIRVCNKALEYNTNNKLDKEKLAKIALLHDVGKSIKSLNIIDKSVLVILDKVTNGRLKNVKNIKVDIYYNHPEKSVKLLKRINKYDKDFLEAVGNHHYKDTGTNEYLKIIKECDDIC